VGSKDIQFIFTNTSLDFQSLSIQGQITYKIEEPHKLAELLDFTVDVRGDVTGEDPGKIDARLINEAQAATSAFIQSLPLKEALKSARNIEANIATGLTSSTAIKSLGIVPLSVNVIAIKPTPEMAKALEATTRESLQQEADQAIYKRRQFAVEQEKTIKESELNIEIAVEEKKKQIAEKKMETEVLQEENRRKLREIIIQADIAIEAGKRSSWSHGLKTRKKRPTWRHTPSAPFSSPTRVWTGSS